MTTLLSRSISVQCPACGSDCSKPPLHRYTASQAASHFCPETRNADRHHRLHAAITNLWQGEECRILQCDSCGFAFGDPFVGGDETFYSILHEQHGYPNWRWDYDVAIQQAIAPHSGGRVLDIGAGIGKFLNALGPTWDRYAIEGSDTTRHQLETQGIQVFPTLEQAIATEAGTFQVITLFQVLEHLADFHTVLSQCRQLLSPGGQLVITVPDGNALLRQERLTGCPDMPPNHINKWTPTSLAHCLRQAGFTVNDPLVEPPSWKNMAYALYVTLLTQAVNANSLAAQVYRLPNRALRIPLLAGLSLPIALRLLPKFAELRQGQAFAMIGSMQ